MKIRITPSYVYLALSLSQVIAAGPVGSQQQEDDYVPRGLDDIEQEEVLAQKIRDEGLKLRDGGQDGKTPGKAFGLETGKRVEGELISLDSNVKRGKTLLEMFDEVDEEEAKAKGLAKAVNAVMRPGSSSGSSDKAKDSTRWPSWDRVKAYVAQTKAAAKGKEAERSKPKSPEQPKPNPTPSGPRVSFRAERYGGHGHPWRLSQLPPGTRTRGRAPPHWTYPPTRTPRPAPRPASSVRIEELPPSPPRRPASPPPPPKRPKKDASGSGKSGRRDLVSNDRRDFGDIVGALQEAQRVPQVQKVSEKIGGRPAGPKLMAITDYWSAQSKPRRKPAPPPPAPKKVKKKSRIRKWLGFRRSTSASSDKACESRLDNEQRGYDDLMEAFYKQYVDRKSEEAGDSTLPVPPTSSPGVASSGPISTSPGRSRRRPKFKKLVDVIAAANKFKVERGLGRTSQASSSKSNWKKLPFKKRPVSPDPLKSLPIKKRPAKVNLFDDLPMKKRPRPNNHSGPARETPQAAPKRYRATPKPRSCIEVDESPLAELQSDNEKRVLGDIAEALDKVDDVVDKVKEKTTSGAGPSLSSAKDKAKGKSRWSSLRRIKDYVGKSKSKADNSLLTSPKRPRPAAVPARKYGPPGPHRAHPSTITAGFINRKYPKATKAAPPATQANGLRDKKYTGRNKARLPGTEPAGPWKPKYPKATKAHPPTTATQANGLRDRKYPGPTRARPSGNGIDGPRDPKHLKGPSRLGRRFAFSKDSKRGLGDIVEALDKVGDAVETVKEKTASPEHSTSSSSAKAKGKRKSRWPSLQRVNDYIAKTKAGNAGTVRKSPERSLPASIIRKYPQATRARPKASGIDGPRSKHDVPTRPRPVVTATSGTWPRKHAAPTGSRPEGTGSGGPPRDRKHDVPTRTSKSSQAPAGKAPDGFKGPGPKRPGLSDKRLAQRLPQRGLPETGDDSEGTLSISSSQGRPGDKRGMAELIGSLHRVENFGATMKTAADNSDDVDDTADVIAAMHAAESSQNSEEASSRIKKMGRKIKTVGKSFGGTADIIAALHNRESSVAHKAGAKGTDDQRSSSKKTATVDKKAEGAAKKIKERNKTGSAGDKAQDVGKRPEDVGKKIKARFRKFKSAVKSPRLPKPTSGRSKDSSARKAKPVTPSAPSPTLDAPSTPPRPSKRLRPQEVGPAPIPPAEKPTVDKRGFADLVASLHEVENAGSKVAEVGDKARNMADAIGLLHKAEADSKLHKAAENDGKKWTAKRVHTFKSLVSSGLRKHPAIVGSNSAGSVDMIQEIYGGAKPQGKPWPSPKMAPQQINSAGWRAWPGRPFAQYGATAPSGFLGHSLRPRPRPSVRRPRRPEAPKRPEGPRRPVGVKRPGRIQRPQRPERRPKRPKTEGDSGGSSSITPRKRTLSDEPRGMGDLVAGLHEIEAASESIKDVAEKLESTAASPDKVEHAAKDAVKPVTSAAPSGSRRPSRSQRGRRISSDSHRPLDEIRKIFGGEPVKNPPKLPGKPGPPAKVSSKPGNSSKFGKYLGVKHALPRRPGYLQRPQRAQRPGRPLTIQRPKPEAYTGVKSPLSPKPRSLDNEKRGMGDVIAGLHDFENAKKKIKLEDKVEEIGNVISALHEAESSKKLEDVVKKKLKRTNHPSFEKTYHISEGNSAFTSPVPPSKLGGPSGPSGRKSMIHKAIDIYAKGKAKDPKSVGIPHSGGWIKTPETGNKWVRPQHGSPERTRPTAQRPFSEGRKTGTKRKSPGRRSLVDHEERGMAGVIAAIHEAESSKTGGTGKNIDSSGDKATGVGRRIREAASAKFERLKSAVKSEPSQSARTQSLIRTKWPGGWHELHVQQRPPSPPRPLKRPKSEDGEQAQEVDRKVKESAAAKFRRYMKAANVGSSGSAGAKTMDNKRPRAGGWIGVPGTGKWVGMSTQHDPPPSPTRPHKRPNTEYGSPGRRSFIDDRGMGDVVASLHELESAGGKIKKVVDKVPVADVIAALHKVESNKKGISPVKKVKEEVKSASKGSPTASSSKPPGRKTMTGIWERYPFSNVWRQVPHGQRPRPGGPYGPFKRRDDSLPDSRTSQDERPLVHDEKRGMADVIAHLHEIESAGKKIKKVGQRIKGAAQKHKADSSSRKEHKQAAKKKAQSVPHPSLEKTFKIGDKDNSAFTSPVPPAQLGGPSTAPSGRKSMIHKALDFHAVANPSYARPAGPPDGRWQRPSRPKVMITDRFGTLLGYKGQKGPSRRSAADIEARGMAEIVASLHQVESSGKKVKKAGGEGKGSGKTHRSFARQGEWSKSSRVG